MDSTLEVFQLISSGGALGIALYVIMLFIRGDIVSRVSYEAITSQIAAEISARIEEKLKESTLKIIGEVQELRNERDRELLASVETTIRGMLLTQKLEQ